MARTSDGSGAGNGRDPLSRRATGSPGPARAGAAKPEPGGRRAASETSRTSREGRGPAPEGRRAAPQTAVDAPAPTRYRSDPLAGREGLSERQGPTPIPTTRRGMLRYRVLPRSVVGISMLILSFAIGSGFSGVILYSYYQYEQNQANDKVNALVNGYKDQFAKAEADLKAAEANAQADIAGQVKAAQALEVGTAQLAAMVKHVAPSVFFVHTLDASGQPSVGSAFVVSSSASQSLLLTSYTTVQAATHAPGPPVFVRQGSTDTPVTVRTWDPQYDLALLVLPKGGLPTLAAAPSSPAPQPGDQLFAVSGLGTAGASISQGSVVDVSSADVAVDSAVGTAFQGGPVINRAGQVVAVGSRMYAPLGFTSDGVYYLPYVEAACSKVLSCPGGTLVGSH